MSTKRDRKKAKNWVLREVTLEKYRPRVVESKVKYNRKKSQGKPWDDSYEAANILHLV